MDLLFPLLLCLSIFLSVSALNSVNGFFDRAKDGLKFKKLFVDNLKASELSSVFYAVQGLNYLKETVPNAEDVCKTIKTLYNDKQSVEQSYYASSAAQILKCKADTLPAGVLKSAVQALDNLKTSLLDLMYSVYTLKALGNKGHDPNTAIKTLKEMLNKDDSANNLGLTFHICVEVGCEEWARSRIEDALAQADQVGTEGGAPGLLHWEGGLPVTANLLSGILKLQATSKDASSISAEQSVKLANYLLSRRTVQTVKGASQLIETITYLADDKKISPISITLSGPGQVSIDSEPIHVSVSDILGRPHPSITEDSVVVQSATRLQDDVVVLSKQKLTPHNKEKNLYLLDLMKVKPERGSYKVGVSAGASTATLSVRVLGAIDIDGVEVGVGDIDGSSAPKLHAVVYPKSLTHSLEADSLQKVIVKFVLHEKGQTQAAKVHQAFVRLSKKSPDTEVIFVAEQEINKVYKMDLDVGSVAENFKYSSGSYNIELIVGDATISNPFRWSLGEVDLKFTGVAAKKEDTVGIRGTKPEIVHMFREPEVRPPRLVSDIFTGLCIAPLFLLFILWAKIGINIRNFPLSLSALGFHLGLGGILGLFVVFWLRLTMFETIRYLLAIGLVTFICGHRLLTDIASKRKNQK